MTTHDEAIEQYQLAKAAKEYKMSTEQQQRKMMECAAKACGIAGEHKTLHYFDGDDTGICSVNHPVWNPITNALDTAEMCAGLEIDTVWAEAHVVCHIGSEMLYESIELYEDHDNSRLKAWMYAATMCAAKIGDLK